MVQPFQNTLKERKRYVLYEPADDKSVIKAYTQLFGVHGAAQAGILSVQTQGEQSILRVSHNAVDQLKAALVYIGKTSLTTSGTLKGARELLAKQ
jgi:RNase P/RNase MRP subunit POP5